MNEFDAKALGKKIRDARVAAGLSREGLALKMCYTESAIAKWEQGKNTPRLPELMSLAEILNVETQSFLGEQQTTVLEELSVVNPTAAKTIIYNGVKEIIPAWNDFWEDYDSAVQNANFNDLQSTWEQKNSFRVLIHRDTRKLTAIRDFGMYQPSTTDFMFHTGYLPIFTHQPETAEVLTKRANETLDLFEAELKNMLSHYERPLFLVEYLGTNNYLAWSLKEQKFLYVYDYKSYRNTFCVSEVTVKSPDEIVANTDYGILPPTKALIDSISNFELKLSPEIWSRKMSWDTWEPRPEKSSVSLHADRYSDLYATAVRLINIGRTTDCGCDIHFANLENRVDCFERLDRLGAPKEILDKAADLIRRSISPITAKSQ